MSDMTDNALIKFIRNAIPDFMALYRFGSQAKGRTRPDSDMDLAVLTRAPIPALRRFELAQELAAQLRCDVDLLDLRSTSTVMRLQVISTGECLAAPDDAARREFEMYTYSDYARLNEERRDILQRIRSSGLVYG